MLLCPYTLYCALRSSRSQAKLFTALGDLKKPERFDREDVASVRNSTVYSERRRLTVLTSSDTNIKCFPYSIGYTFPRGNKTKQGSTLTIQLTSLDNARG